MKKYLGMVRFYYRKKNKLKNRKSIYKRTELQEVTKTINKVTRRGCNKTRVINEKITKNTKKSKNQKWPKNTLKNTIFDAL